MPHVSMTVNGKVRKAHVEPRMLLVHFLREQLILTGTHVGCDTSQCGACTVLIDGRSAKSCTIFAVQADGSRDHHDRRPGDRTASCTRCRKASGKSTACSAATARPA